MTMTCRGKLGLCNLGDIKFLFNDHLAPNSNEKLKFSAFIRRLQRNMKECQKIPQRCVPLIHYIEWHGMVSELDFCLVVSYFLEISYPKKC